MIISSTSSVAFIFSSSLKNGRLDKIWHHETRVNSNLFYQYAHDMDTYVCSMSVKLCLLQCIVFFFMFCLAVFFYVTHQELLLLSYYTVLRRLYVARECKINFNKKTSLVQHNYNSFLGGMHADLSNVATQIRSLSIRQMLTILANWLAGKLSTMPDYLSRLDNKFNAKIFPNLFGRSICQIQ